MDVAALSGAHCHLAEDDDISLSSVEESKCDEDEDEDENENCQQEANRNHSNKEIAKKPCSSDGEETYFHFALKIPIKRMF